MTRAVAARRGSVVALLLAAAFLLTGCGAVRGILDTERAIRAAGYRDVTVGFESDAEGDAVTVGWTPNDDSSEGMRIEAHDIARIVWEHAPVRFDVVRLTAESGESFRFSRSQLREEYGPRPIRLEKTPAELLNVRGLVIGVVVAFVVGTLLAVLLVVLIVRSFRKRRAEHPPWAPPPGQWGGPPQGQWTQPVPPPGQWTVPPSDPWQPPPG